MEAHTALLVTALDAQAPVGLREAAAELVARQEAEALDVRRVAAAELDAQLAVELGA